MAYNILFICFIVNTVALYGWRTRFDKLENNLDKCNKQVEIYYNDIRKLSR